MSCLRYAIPISLVIGLLGPIAIASERLPLDPKVNMGKLDNGLTYYLRENQHPEARAELRLIVNAGSVLENEDERGLAHFLEHMVFNGSEHFAPGELVKFLESIGLRFGADLNAYTGFDETVFILPVPTDKPELLDQAFLVLSDWARRATIKPEEVDKERGVVLDEWRRGRDADARMRDKQFPVLFHGSRYAERLPIGSTEIIEKAPADRIRAFYDRWYQPDNMAVIAVGDFKLAEVKQLIEKHFGAFKKPERATARPTFAVPGHEATLFALASDPEATQTAVQVAFKSPQRPYLTDADFRRELITQFVSQMLTVRFQEIARQKDPPFLFAGAQLGGAIRGASIFGVYTVTEDGKAEAGLEAVLRELKRARQHGFIAAELERMKAEMLAFIERSYSERDKAESASFITDYMEHFLEGRAAPGIEVEWPLAQRTAPGITLDDVNRELGALLTQENRVVLANMPEKTGVKAATQESFAAVLKGVEAAEVDAYQDRTTSRPLIAALPKAGTVAHSERNQAVDAEVLTLGNGMTVWVKSTDFKNDQIIMRAYAYGGLAMAKPEQFTSAQLAVGVVEESGIGGFNPTDLEKLMAGKMAGLAVRHELPAGLHGVGDAEGPRTRLRAAAPLLHRAQPR
ncbi:MAG: pitrilysin family protein [Planctomycetota bacterium]